MQKPDNNCQITRIVTISFVNFFMPTRHAVNDILCKLDVFGICSNFIKV